MSRRFLKVTLLDNVTDEPLATDILRKRREDEASGKLDDDPNKVPEELIKYDKTENEDVSDNDDSSGLKDNENPGEKNDITDKVNDADIETDDKEDDDAISKEAITIFSQYEKSTAISLEGLITIIKLQESVATEDTKDVLLALKRHGFHYGAISVQHLSKTILFILNKTYEGLIKSIAALIDFAQNRSISYKYHLKVIDDLREKIDQLDDEKEHLMRSKVYENRSVIQQIVTSKSNNLEENMRTVIEFSQLIQKRFLSVFNAELWQMNSYLDFFLRQKTFESNEHYFDRIDFKEFIPLRNQKNKLPVVNGVDILQYPKELPGGEYAILYCPKSFNSQNIDDVAMHVKNARFFFNLDANSEIMPKILHYPSKDEMRVLTQLAKELCEIGLIRNTDYLKYIADYKKFTNKYKSYADIILQRKNRVTIRETYIETISPTIYFIEHICLFGSMKIDDFNGRFLKALLMFIRDTIREWNKTSPPT